MILSTHYYVLSLSEHTNRLYEAFRSNLIDIENTWFPLESLKNPSHEQLSNSHLRTLLEAVDGHFGHYYEQEPLGVILAGTGRYQNTFTSVTKHGSTIIGGTKGDHSATSSTDLGHITWPIVKSAMASANHKWERELDDAIRTERLVPGIDPVTETLGAGIGGTLLVEESYELIPDPDAGLIDDDNDRVDEAIHGVLALGGHVIFLDDGALSKYERIALILENGNHQR